MLLSNLALAHRLLDLPRWVEIRDLLLSGDGDIIGFQAARLADRGGKFGPVAAGAGALG